jgi:hypothetical protein
MRVRTRNLSLALGAIAVFLAGLPLLNLNNIFYVDWVNHLWMSEYYGKYLQRNFMPPEVINTVKISGMVMLIFYAGKFYVFVGAFSSFIGSVLSIRLAPV